ncbi:hypothetical protein GQ55_3G075400 [Panicum hallii var. hallii]|uniref:Uncharacterized protein n=1 Tax=Panicum hallii var. hallii TaxID=1504633 RepID=A0A2T7E6S8_9POAL|nr:hypothetical protein GQ55_3G075400 [Panicum hallii var. hallii]
MFRVESKATTIDGGFRPFLQFCFNSLPHFPWRGGSFALVVSPFSSPLFLFCPSSKPNNDGLLNHVDVPHY